MANQFSYLKKIPQEEVNEIKRKFLLSKRKINGECWEWHGPMVAPKNKYGYTTHNFGEKKKKYMCHRLSYILWKGNISEKMLVCHKCDNPRCFNPDHLFLGTDKDNQDDSRKKGRFKKAFGEKHCQSKLSDDQVREIRKLRKSGWTYSKIKDKYKVGMQTIASILFRETWKHL